MHIFYKLNYRENEKNENQTQNRTNIRIEKNIFKNKNMFSTHICQQKIKIMFCVVDKNEKF